MSTNTINITMEEVRSIAGTIEGLNTELTDNLNAIKNHLTKLEDTWQSDAATTIVSKMRGMETTFSEYESVVADYVEFLRNTATAYETAESSINTYASDFA